MIKKREEVIVALLKADDFLTAHQLAQDLKLSTKTIYRAVKEINQSFGQTVIISERGKGLLLDYDRYLMLSN
ncbi:helix-turn-helix domain-containing protein [uncultured Limosilactobacillus sp.]|nr:helix-turn-helix domain-containing protein [uncultured Limosilactobacillus sp.]